MLVKRTVLCCSLFCGLVEEDIHCFVVVDGKVVYDVGLQFWRWSLKHVGKLEEGGKLSSHDQHGISNAKQVSIRNICPKLC